MSEHTVDGIRVIVTRKRIKNFNLRVGADRKVTLSVPYGTSDEKIDGFIRSHADWISASLEKMKNAKSWKQIYADGRTVSVVGKEMVFRTAEGNAFGCRISDGTMTVTVPKGSSYNDLDLYMREWYRTILKDILPNMIRKYETMTGLSCSGWQTKFMKTKWGTCNCTTKKIWLNVRLAEKPIKCIEYVVLHELAHTRVANHGPDFKNILDTYMPDWKERKKILNGGSKR